MYNITLVCTHHSEFGKCNSDELYKIIESIRPDVIFEELPQDLFDKFYIENIIPNEPPEIISVKRYLSNHDIIHLPVDINLSPNVYKKEIENMFKTFKSYRIYSMLEEEQKNLAFHEGFDFLNSKKNEEYIERKKSIEKSLIPFLINKEQLSNIYKLFYDEQHQRENEIIKNIYNYSEEIAYNQAILLFGSGHRKTFIEKVRNCESKQSIKLNWSFYGN